MLDDYYFDNTIVSFGDELATCGVTIEHNGEIYPLEWPETYSESGGGKGFRVEPYIPGVDETPVMRFGKFELGKGGYHGEEFTIDWGESLLDRDVVKFDFYLTERGRDGYSNVEIKIWVNETLMSEGSLDVDIANYTESPIIEYGQFDFIMFVNNSAGENLLDPATEGNIPGRDIKVEYNGEIWPLAARTRYYPPQWNGLRIEPLNPYKDDSPTVLKFGEFPTGGEGCRGEKFTIDWGDGTTSHVKFDCYLVHGLISPVTGNDLIPTTWPTKIWVDGELVSEGLHPKYGLAVEIVK